MSARSLSAAFFALVLLVRAAGSMAEMPGVLTSEISRKIHELVNIKRAEAGLRPLAWSDRLAELARLHSEDMARSDYFDYTDRQGNDPSQRAKAMGFECGKNYGYEIKVGLAENIYFADSYIESKSADGKTTFSPLSADQIAETVVKGLLKPGGYRENILDGEYTLEGIGAAADKYGRILVTQDFCLGELALPEPEKKPELIPAELAKLVHDYVNRERGKRRMPLLAWNDKLALAARLHSEDMAKNRYFAHKNREGKDPTKRAYDIGFRCEKKSGSYIKIGVGENISQNNTATSVTYIGDKAYPDYQTMDEIAKTTVEGWMNSPGHRENILTYDYTSEGIGVAVSDKGEVFITEDFC